jgi:hypothetical protein
VAEPPAPQTTLPNELPRWAAERIERDGYPWNARDVGPVSVRPSADRAAAFWRECVRLLREEKPRG